MKSIIPLSKLKGLQDELDIPELVEFKCSNCVNCPTCKLSARAKTKSMHESFEQEVIEKSVHVDIGNQRVWVNLPFVKEHRVSDNKRQTLWVNQAQCSKQNNCQRADQEGPRGAGGQRLHVGTQQTTTSNSGSHLQCAISLLLPQESSLQR